MGKRSNIRKAFIIFLLLMLVIIQLSSCGVTEYKTKHDCGTYVVSNYDDFDRLAFKFRTSVNEVSKIIPNFCIYGDSTYTACVPLDMKNWNVPSDFGFEQYDSTVEDAELYINFNADKEFTGFVIYFGDGYSRAAFFGKIIFSGKYSLNHDNKIESNEYLSYNFINGVLDWNGMVQSEVNKVTYYPNV